MAKTKGSLLAARLRYLDVRHGQEGRSRVLAALSPATRTLLEAPPDADVWVPFEALVELTKTIDDVLGTGDLALAADTGRFSADLVLGGMRDALTASGPIFLFRQAPSVWHQHYDSGTVEGGLLSRSHGVFRVVGFDAPAAAHCASVRGWIARTLELTGILDVVVDHVYCRARGDDSCQYDCSWREP